MWFVKEDGMCLQMAKASLRKEAHQNNDPHCSAASQMCPWCFLHAKDSSDSGRKIYVHMRNLLQTSASHFLCTMHA